MKRKCPHCKSSDGVRIILWGMPIETPDQSKYVIGGCSTSDFDPDYRCIACGLEFFTHEKERQMSFQRFVIKESNGIVIERNEPLPDLWDEY